MPAADPSLWRVDDLIGELCDSRELYKAAGNAITNVPDLKSLEHQLHARQITGSKFLSFDNTALVVRNELEIPNLAQRLALMSVVDLLRRRSQIYSQQAATAGVGLLNINSASDNSVSDNTSFADDTRRKRRKVTHVTTTPLPLPTTSQDLSEADIASDQGPFPGQPPTGTGEWDHLLRWQQQGDDEIIDLNDEEPEAAEQLSLVDTAEEDHDIPEEDEAAEGPTTRSKLSPEQVVDIINERIEFYTNSWFANKGVARSEEVQYDTETMWEEAEASGKRQELVQKYETDYAYYSQRLDRLCLEIVKSPGSNLAQIRRQCSNLEVTIDSMELAVWLRDIYRLEPEESSNEETGFDDQATGNPSDDMLRSAHRSKPSVEIIDLGSPSESSGNDEENASPSDHPQRTATANTIGVRTLSLRRHSTPDSVIAETVEPLVYEHSILPAPNPALPMRTPINHGDEPENASMTTVRRWKWTDLSENLDRKRVVSKAIHEMDDREVIRNRIKHIGKTSLIKEIKNCVDMLSKGQSRMQGVLPRDLSKIITFTNLFLCWWFCQNYFSQPTASIQDLEELKRHLEDGTAEISIFYDYVLTVMGATFSPQALQNPERPSQAEIIEISDDDD